MSQQTTEDDTLNTMSDAVRQKNSQASRASDTSYIVESHKFYLKQAKSRLLGQLRDIQDAAKAGADDWLADNEVVERGEWEHSLPELFTNILVNLLIETRLSIAASIYHRWEKDLKKKIIGTGRVFHKIKKGRQVVRDINSSNHKDLLDVLSELGCEIRNTDIGRKLDECRLVVNLYKHGAGNAFNTIRNSHPEYLASCGEASSSGGGETATPEGICISDEHLDAFSEAIVAFWKKWSDQVDKNARQDPRQGECSGHALDEGVAPV